MWKTGVDLIAMLAYYFLLSEIWLPRVFGSLLEEFFLANIMNHDLLYSVPTQGCVLRVIIGIPKRVQL